MKALLIAGAILLATNPALALVTGVPIVGAPYTGWTQTIAGDTDTGWFGMAIDRLGSAHFAVRSSEAGVGYLWPVPGGGAWVREEVYANGFGPDLALDAQGAPHLVFEDIGTPKTLYATKTPSGWVIETVDGLNGSRHSRIRVDDLGRVHVVYAGRGNEGFGLRYAVRENGVWNIQVISPNAGVSWLGFDLDADGNAHITYDDTIIRYATNKGGSWQVSNIGTGRWPDLAIDSTGAPHIAWRSGGTLRYANLVDGAWSFETADADTSRGDSPSIDTDEADRPHIAYNDASLAMPFGSKARYVTKTASGAWVRETITPPAGETWGFAELRVDADGLPRIAYPFVDTQIVHVTYPLKIVVAQPAIRAVLPYGVLT